MKFKAITFSLISTVTMAAQLPLSAPDTTETGFDTMELAAAAGVKIAMDDSQESEYAGSVYNLNGKFYYTLPVSQESDRSVDYRIAVPNGAHLVALFHTHPSSLPGSIPDQFSDSDLDVGKRMNLVMFVGVIHAQKMIEFNPNTDHPVYSFKNHSAAFTGSHSFKIG